MNTNTILLIALVLPGGLSLTGCSTAKSTAIDVVKNGILTGYDSTTVGKAFEGTFQAAKWTSFVSPKGATIVQFDGTVTRDALDRAEFIPSDDNRISPVTFQFNLSENKTTFELGYIDMAHFTSVGHPSGVFEKNPAVVLAFIYH